MHNGGGDSLGIASAARYALANWGVDPTRVFAAGVSSGGMMTTVLAGAYPDIFSAASAVGGVPFGCNAVPDGPPDSLNLTCLAGNISLSGNEWV